MPDNIHILSLVKLKFLYGQTGDCALCPLTVSLSGVPLDEALPHPGILVYVSVYI